MFQSLVDNLSSLLLAFLLAVMVWMVAVTQDQGPPIRELYPEDGLPIETIETPEGLVLYEQVDRRAQMEVLAPRSNIQDLVPSDFRVFVDLSELSPGVHEVRVHWQCPECDRKQVRVLGVEPERISVRLEERVERAVPVRPVFQGSTATGYRAQQPQVEPEQVTVSGPRSLVEEVDSVRADIYLFNQDSTVDRGISVTAVDSEGNLITGVTLTPSQVDVTVPIVPEGRRKEVDVTSNTVGEPAPGYYPSGISVEPQTVVLTGTPSRIREAPGFVATEPVNIAGARESVEVEVPIRVPEGLQLLDPANQTVTVRVEIAPFTGGRSFEVAPTFQGLESGFQADVSPARVQVFIFGPVPEVQELSAEDIQVILDLTDLEPGRHRIEPTVQVSPERLEVRTTLPEVVEVTITAPEGTLTPSPVPTATPTPTLTGTPAPTMTPQSTATSERAAY